MTGVQCVAGANNASHSLSPSKRKCHETVSRADEKMSHTVKALLSRRDTAALPFLILQLCLGIRIPWSLIIIINAMFSLASDSVTFLFWFSVLSHTPSCLFLPLIFCALMFLLIFFLSFSPCTSYIIQVETLFSEL